MPSLLVVRHAQASFGAADYDVLSEAGRAQAAALDAELARRELRVARIVTGALRRQRDTVAPLAQRLGVGAEADARWDEYGTDDLMSAHATTLVREHRAPGSDAPAISSRAFQDLLEEALLAWIAAGADGPARETWPAFAARVDGALRDAAAGLGSGETAVVCTSGGVLAALVVALLGVAPGTFVRFNRVAVNAGLSTVAVGRAGATLITYNEHGYLPAPLVTYR